MLGKLVPITVKSPYGGLLPKRLALLAEDAAAALSRAQLSFETKNALFRLTDAYRDPNEQARAHNDWRTGKKKAYSPPAGYSMHEAGRAIDVDLAVLIHLASVPKGYTMMPENEVRDLLQNHGWVPIANQGNPHKVDVKESWHFEFRGQFRKTYNEELSRTKDHSKAYRAMAKAAIADVRSGATVLILKRGSKGQEVRLLQEALHVPIDGVFGEKTEAAVIKFQVSHGLKADGIVGPATARILFGDDLGRAWSEFREDE